MDVIGIDLMMNLEAMRLMKPIRSKLNFADGRISFFQYDLV